MTTDVASHRKPKQHPLAGNTARTAATLALAGVATATALDGTGNATPPPTKDQVKARVGQYYREAEVATERYNGVREKADRARSALDGLQDEAARRTERLTAARNALGSFATAQYREGGLPPAVRLLLSSSPDRYLERASLADRAGSLQAVALTRVRSELRGVERVRTTAAARLAELKDEQAALSRHKRTVEAKLDDARRLLDRLTAEERAAFHGGGEAAGAPAGGSSAGGAERGTAASTAPLGERAGRSAPRGGAQAPTERAARAVAFAYSALGKPYVWGATGPSGFDCSGLTQAAWRSAGVSLPRTTYTQINAGRRIGRSQLAPGDLVFFYSGVSHVGLYIGGGKMIHAPHPGAPVRIAPVDQMPFAGAARPV
ncbi:putative endopeptidase precursor [Streptomyces netropsis]|uniref:Cell wall-associated NlpC family hydrolase n=1 Tax=Streptomyces syringium TaxID=76729 RepID=A0ABS4Y782_9ACTN|nr:C40 family peptidase [Streptomyces syringium]MBP2404642.1 cell wall-associated NlpC family hydrolase [Streptomyces syringium]SPE57585.1 putative endopeptidase precursor [Streptomyces netropsis]